MRQETCEPRQTRGPATAATPVYSPAVKTEHVLQQL
eukprot:CAMPEP_0118977464 /NCGR_PEP_ID=MMETSP1173-20130426/21493_1 /TAXON_ID=1034831 /ORGANISM="Rhizochromulina marina cf, Strain CCMP1243" /LENGTH=35 /DNA_ID= /DNA_START= /DNA_END= /DNA_ORIENTATION=